jgi:catechol 2,3-dioxygenase-like lactoylglutathione lyase family enzyme
MTRTGHQFVKRAKRRNQGDGVMSGARLFHVNLNVTDLDRSIAFYRLLGFEVLVRMTWDEDTTRQAALAFRIDPNEAEFALMRIGNNADSPCLDLVQWRTRPTTGRPYEQPNHTGIFRFMIHVEDVHEIIAKLREAGIQPVGEIVRATPVQGQAPTTMFCVADPDGIMVQVASGMDHLVR